MTRIASAIKMNPWLACPGLNPEARLRLFCFPYSGAGASIFYGWSKDLPSIIEVYPVQLPGRENRLVDPPFSRMEDLVEAACGALLPHLDKPFAFFGHSLGALLGFELARTLRRDHDVRPVHLFVSSHAAPQISDNEPPIHDLPEPAFIAKIRSLNGMSKAILESHELMELLVPILRADFSVCETYAYEDEEPLDCPISAYGGLQDEHVSRTDLDAWRLQTSRAFSLRMFPGDHFYLNTDRSRLLHAVMKDLKLTTPARQ